MPTETGGGSKDHHLIDQTFFELIVPDKLSFLVAGQNSIFVSDNTLDVWGRIGGEYLSKIKGEQGVDPESLTEQKIIA